MTSLIRIILLTSASVITASPALACNPQWGPCAGVVYTGPVGPQDYGQQSQMEGQMRGQQVERWADKNRAIVNSWGQQAPRSGPHGGPNTRPYGR
ncbi:hypothetical protein Ga0061061_11710 [Chelatococcus sambhunathii]|uniref:Uncharacterized protein n=1 Tax=Chelatococcus sambhunathii TaxID=363953 RepID=A0ABM9U9S6_9HYPH|nr:hypothetical protein [Chelatococcus sambhunathii]CUA90950.1 hypothetical protein Ga0061061_11710 [Chelatococcus sambhunathii]